MSQLQKANKVMLPQDVLVTPTDRELLMQLNGIPEKVNNGQLYKMTTDEGESVRLTDDIDLNTVLKTGNYRVVVLNHSFVVAGTYLLMVIQHDGSALSQILINENSKRGSTYVRARNSVGAWGYWTRLLNNEDYDQLFQSVSSGKTAIANATTQKGVPTAVDAEFATMANNILQIPAGKKVSQGNGVVSANTMSATTGFKPEVVHVRGSSFVGDFIFDSLLESPTTANGMVLSQGTWVKTSAPVTRDNNGFMINSTSVAISGNFSYIAYG